METAHLRAAGSSLLLSVDPTGSARVVAWGADLGDLDDTAARQVVQATARQRGHSSIDQPRLVELVTQTQHAYTGRPTVSVGGAGVGGPPYFSGFRLDTAPASATVRCTDPVRAAELTCHVSMDPAGVLLLDYQVTNHGHGPLGVGSVLPSLPVPAQATEVLDLTGRWARERSPQRRPFHQGAWVRESRHGRTGHDATLLMVAGTDGFGFGHGEVWGVHVAWSGNHTSYAEATPEGDRRLGGGELLDPGEVVLAPGESYAAPTLVAAWSDAGLDGLSARLHDHVRTFPHLAGLARPVVLNTWEAVYFDHDVETLTRLARAAADVGVERFVLDDGWSEGRVHDQTGLGDWRVDRDRWGEGLHPLVDQVHALGMEFGLWVEPEMVHLDSALARAHPEWVLTAGDRLPLPWRHQQVLDLQRPDAYAHIRDALLALLDEYEIAFLKWDHNRDVFDGLHDDRPAVHGQSLATYRMLDELTERHPRLQVESCASGGARIDLGVLRRTHRVWASDTHDAIERVGIQRWTSLLVPPEVVGSHVGGPVSHTTGRHLPLGFRAAVSLLCHFGVEWDLLSASPDEVRSLADWIALHKQVRGLVSGGRLVRPDHPDPSMVVTGMVAPDRRTACFVLAQVAASTTSTPAPVRLTGLDAALDYSVERCDPAEAGELTALSPWFLDEQPVRLSGQVLGVVGLQPPVLPPHSARVLLLRAVGT